MQITDIETILLTGPCTGDPYLSKARKYRSAAFIKISTDTEYEGLGETYAGYFCPEMVPQIVEFFKPILIGINPEKMDVSQLWQRMYHCGNFWSRVGLGAIVLNGIEAALWDLKGKIHGMPVCNLLGGAKHETLPCYATGGPSNYPMDELFGKLEFYASLGFKAAKIGAGEFYEDKGFLIFNDPQKAAKVEWNKFAAVNERFGDSISLMMDAHMGNSPSETWSLETATAVVRAIEPYAPVFLEEPLHYTDPWGYAQLCKSTSIPIAGGECLTAEYEWKVFVERDSFDIGQPDASFTGGLDQFMRVAGMLADRGRTIAPHAWGAGGSLMQNVHCGFACANTKILEVAPAYGPLHSEIMGDSFVMKDGMVHAPQTPGLGIRLTQATIDKFKFRPGTGEFNSVTGKILKDQGTAMLNILTDLKINESRFDELKNISGVNVCSVEQPAEITRPLPEELIKDIDVLLCTFLPENHEKMANLKFVQIASAGFTQLIGKGLPVRGIKACNARGVNDVPIAEWNISMIINLARDLPQMLRNQQTATWDRDAKFQKEIRSLTLGIWGYGGIGRQTARLAKALGLNVHVLDAYPVGPRDDMYCVEGTGDIEGKLPDKTFLPGQEKEFFAGLDFLVLSMPLMPATEGIMGTKQFEMLKPSAYLLNPARGPLVKESALLDALDRKLIAGAALDTHYHYPMPADHPLWKYPNVIMTPHISGSSASPHFLDRVWDLFNRNVKRFFNNQNLLNLLNNRELE